MSKTLRLCDEPGCEAQGRHVVNCPTCLGFGLTLSGAPIAAVNDVGAGQYVPCPVCGGTPNGAGALNAPSAPVETR